MTLLDLPDELLVCISEQLADSKEALRELILACRHFRAIVEPILYREIFFRKPNVLARLLAAFKAAPNRLNSIHKLDARCKFQESGRTSARRLEPLGTILNTACNINDLTVESPYCNNRDWQAATSLNGWDATMHSWLWPILQSGKSASGREQAGLDAMLLPSGVSRDLLPGLKRLTLHLNGVEREFWTVEREDAFVFAHQTLEEIHVSSINIPEHAMNSIREGVRTPLKRLTLDEANVTMHGLRCMLAIPIALEYLYIGENRYSPEETAFPPDQEYNNLCRRSAAEVVEALRVQKTSLKTLIYRADDEGESAPLSSYQGPDFSEFIALKTISFTGDWGWMSTGLCRTTTAPPDLQNLTLDEFPFLDVLESGNHSETEPPRPISNIADANTKLHTLTITSEHSGLGRLAAMTGERTAIKLAGEFLRRKDVALRLTRPASRQMFVPPYLYGEEPVADLLIYENNDAGFREEGGHIGIVDHDSDSDWTDDTDRMEYVDEEDWDDNEDDRDDNWEDEMNWGAQT
ncbi:hypothetical protein LTR86_007876 [Recurvomyces mirabilis]|nr:hypothetical protein LTR86_007876 [Recurvomyces mirabilis]